MYAAPAPATDERPAGRRPPTARSPAVAVRPSRVAVNRCACGGAAGGSVAPPVVHDVLRSPGESLPPSQRALLEARFATDLSAVRVHTGARAAASARAVGGRAYTVGRHVVFGSDAYAPGTADGQRLLAHELTHVVQQGGASSIPARLEIGRVDDPSEGEAERVAHGAVAAPRRAAAPRAVLARYAHQDCAEADLKSHVWPADHLAQQMVKKAIGILSASPVDPSVAALFPKYFMTTTPNVSTILGVFNKVDAEFSDNDYTYECEEDCESDDNGYTTIGLFGALVQAHIHLCMNNFRSRSNECLARTVVHEFTHRYAGTGDKGYCKSGCGYSTCPSSLTAAKALENADSYACFAYELWGLVAAAPSRPPPATGGGTGAGGAGPVDAGAGGPVDAGVPGGVP